MTVKTEAQETYSGDLEEQLFEIPARITACNELVTALALQLVQHHLFT